LTASVGMLAELGIDDIAQYARTLHERCSGGGRDRRAHRIRARGRAPLGGSFASPGAPRRGYHALKRAHVVCSLREGAIRLAPHCYNTRGGVERVMDVMDQLDKEGRYTLQALFPRS